LLILVLPSRVHSFFERTSDPGPQGPCSSGLSPSIESGRQQAGLEQLEYLEIRCTVNYTGSRVPALQCQPLHHGDKVMSWSATSHSVSYTHQTQASENGAIQTFHCGIQDSQRQGNSTCGEDCIMATNVADCPLQILNVTFIR